MHGVPSGQAVRVDRSHLERNATTKGRAGWRKEPPGPDGTARLTGDAIWQQLMASDVGSQRALELIQQYRVAEQTGRLVETKGRQAKGGDDDDE